MTRRSQDIDHVTEKNPQPIIEDANALPAVSMQPVGVVHSTYLNHFDAPRQPRCQTDEKGADRSDAIIVLCDGLQNMARDLKGIERIWILFHFNYSVGCKQTVIPPRDSQPRGLFATRSPHRPNPIGLSCVRLINVVGLKIFIRDHDLLHGTAVLDIKPYLPYCESFPDAKCGWIDGLADDAADHRWD